MEEVRNSFMGKDSCCGCIPSKIGILILSSLSLFFGILRALLAAVVLGLYETSYYHGGEWQPVIILWMIIEVQKIIITSLFIAGVGKENYVLMCPSLCWDFAFICTIIPAPFMAVFYIPVSVALNFLIFIALNLIVCSLMHWLLVSYNYYEHLRSKKSERSAEQKTRA